MIETRLDDDAALVVFSGGQDSSTCIAWALNRFRRVETIGFYYGQAHSIEMDVRTKVRGLIAGIDVEWAARLGIDHVHEAGVIADIGQSALTGGTASQMHSQGLPETFVPGRNLVFLILAATLAYRRGIRHIVTGVCETDYSGYPDCRDDTIKALQVALNLGTDVRFVIDTPLMWVNKAETWKLAHILGGPALVEIIRKNTHTCYLGVRTKEHEWGYGCGECAACQLRANGWAQFRSEGTDI